MQNIFYLGIRHHGPGSAYSVLQALAEIQPDLVMIEGPPEAEAVLAQAGEAQMEPPVALLVYAEDDLADASFYPFAVFSPEWQALRHGLRQGTPVRLMDLPQTHHFALLRQAKAKVVEVLTNASENGDQNRCPCRLYLQERVWGRTTRYLAGAGGRF
ncbi:MAG: DUF5682 family protein [Caldilineaceae bacterium]